MNSPIRLLTTLIVGIIIWVGLMTVIQYQEQASDRQEQRAQVERETRARQEQRHHDCLASLETRDNAKNLTIDQWTKLVELLGSDPEDEALLAEFSAYINEQYEALPLPALCQESADDRNAENDSGGLPEAAP